MFRLDMNNLTNSPQTQPIISSNASNVPMHFTMGRKLMRTNAPSVSPALLFFQTPMIPNVSQAKGGCGSCGGTR
jgi:hypothetical protein